MTANRPFFSICIPNYNYAHYLSETVESVLEQSFKDFEIIIVDNCSTDDSWEVMQRLAEGDSRIQIFRNPANIGFAPNLQAASEKANGRFINLLSADDKMSPDALAIYAQYLERLEEDQLVFAFSDTFHIDGDSERFRVETRTTDSYVAEYRDLEAYSGSEEPIETNGHELLKRTLGKLKNPAPFLSVVYSHSLWKQVGGYNAPRVIGPDKFFNYKCLGLDPLVYYFQRPLFQYRVHQTANALAQASNAKQQLDDYLNILDFGALAEKVGVGRSEMIESYLNRVCFKSAIQALLAGNSDQARRCLGSMSFFPEYRRRISAYYLLKILLIMPPISKAVLRLLNAIRTRN